MLLKLFVMAALLTGVRSFGGPNELESFYSITWNMETFMTRGCFVVTYDAA